MPSHPNTGADQPHRDDRPFRSSKLYALLAALAALAGALALGEMTMRAHTADRDNERHLDVVSRAAVLRAKVERELSAVLYLSSGLGSYLTVRSETLRGTEIREILSVLYRSSRNVRNFGIAIGYRLTYVYPLKGNEEAIGLYYPDHPDQWRIIERIVSSGKPALAGPVNLVQGGRGIVYRVPLFIDGAYWGLLSTVIDADAFFEAISEDLLGSRYQFALRGRDGQGLGGAPIWGDVRLFDRQEAVIQEIEVPGGRWAIAVTAQAETYSKNIDVVIRLLSMALGILIAWMLYALIRSRTELARRAMFDGLTGLPNRHLFEDRAEMAFSRQARVPEQLTALLFIDLDGFKAINDEYGHKAGDAVLVASAARAKATVRNQDTVARWGGDEFIVLLENINADTVATLSERLREHLEVPVEFEGHQLAIGISIGMAIHTEADGDLDEMLKIADQRMYEDKLSRRRETAT